MKKLLIISLTFILLSCGVPQKDYDSLFAEKEDLLKQLDECNFGADKTLAIIKDSYKENDFKKALENIDILKERHPEATQSQDYKSLVTSIVLDQQSYILQKKAEEKERLRKENYNNTGIWRNAFYVDDFGESTKDGYITTTRTIKGLFSNSATQDSDLKIRFLITSSSKVSFQLYEYAGNNPVKAYSYEIYRVLIQDKDGERLTLQAVNYSSDRLRFDKKHSIQVHNILLKGGEIKFKIIENDTPTTEYEFTIINADYYENAYRKLKEAQ